MKIKVISLLISFCAGGLVVYKWAKPETVTKTVEKVIEKVRTVKGKDGTVVTEKVIVRDKAVQHVTKPVTYWGITGTYNLDRSFNVGVSHRLWGNLHTFTEISNIGSSDVRAGVGLRFDF
jgi:hypothetical protein